MREHWRAVDLVPYMIGGDWACWVLNRTSIGATWNKAISTLPIYTSHHAAVQAGKRLAAVAVWPGVPMRVFFEHGHARCMPARVADGRHVRRNTTERKQERKC